MEPSVWNDKVLTDLKTLAELQFSAAKIAAQLAIKHGISVTRSAVIGKAGRAKIKLYGDVAKFGFKQKRASRKGMSRIKPRMGPVKNIPTIDPLPFKPSTEKVESRDVRALIELQDHHCRWPIDGPKGDLIGFCGNDKHGEFPYCSGHCSIAYPGIRNLRARTPAPQKKSARWGGWA